MGKVIDYKFGNDEVMEGLTDEDYEEVEFEEAEEADETLLETIQVMFCDEVENEFHTMYDDCNDILQEFLHEAATCDKQDAYVEIKLERNYGDKPRRYVSAICVFIGHICRENRIKITFDQDWNTNTHKFVFGIRMY